MATRGPLKNTDTTNLQDRLSEDNQTLPMPRTLTSEAKKEWKRVVPVLNDMGLVCAADRACLIAYCETWAMMLQALQIVRDEGMTVPHGSSIKRHPALDYFENAKGSLLSYARELCLTSYSRQRIQAVDDSAKTDDLAAFISKKEG